MTCFIFLRQRFLLFRSLIFYLEKHIPIHSRYLSSGLILHRKSLMQIHFVLSANKYVGLGYGQVISLFGYYFVSGTAWPRSQMLAKEVELCSIEQCYYSIFTFSFFWEGVSHFTKKALFGFLSHC